MVLLAEEMVEADERGEKRNKPEFHLNFPKLRPENMEEKPEGLQQGRVKRELPSPLFQKAFWWHK